MTQIDPMKAQLVEAATPHVAFDGWGVETFKAAVADAEMDPALARSLCPRGATDLAVAYHQMGDAAMVARLGDSDLDGMRFRDRVAHAIRLRLAAVDDKEVVRRGTTLFALPHIDRRIDDVMQFERVKSATRENAAFKPLTTLLGRLTAGIKAPGAHMRDDLPGMWRDPR